MKFRLASAAFAISVLSGAAHAQTIVDMGQFTCAQYLAMSPAMSRHFSAWVSGWAAYQVRRTYVDVYAHQKNTESMKSWCQFRPQASVMDAVKGVIGPQ
jgi:HdeA/HdeB family protein